MIVAIFLVRERTDIIKRKPHMDWDMLSDVPFLLMSVGKHLTNPSNSICSHPLYKNIIYTLSSTSHVGLTATPHRSLLHLLGHLLQLLLHRRIRAVAPAPRQPSLHHPPDPHERHQPLRPPAPIPPLRPPPRPRQHHHPLHLPHRPPPLPLDRRHDRTRHHGHRLLLRPLLRRRPGPLQPRHLGLPGRQHRQVARPRRVRLPVHQRRGADGHSDRWRHHQA